MEGSKEDKVEAFRLFDFDKSDEFKAFLRNVECTDDRALLKVKAKWYKRKVDSDFELEWLPSLAAAAAPQPAPAAAAAAAPQQQPQQQQQQQRPPPQPAAYARPAGRSPQWEASRQFHLAILQLLVLVFSVLYLQPLRPALSTWAYGKLMMTLLVSQGLKVHTAHGLPAGRSLAAIQQWLMRVMPLSDAQYFLLAFAAAGNKPVTAVLPPFVVLSAYHLAHYIAESRVQWGWPSPALWARYGEPVYLKMQANKQAALQFNAQSEIMLGFLLVVGILFPWRAPMLAFLVWQFLRMRFWSPDAAVYHRQAWANFGQLTAVVRQQVPILQKVVDFGVGFFHQNRGA